MLRRKKNLKDMTIEEIRKRIFPKKVRDRLKEIAHEKDGKTSIK